MLVPDETGDFYQRAIADFHNARRKAAMESILARLRGKPTDLLSYDEVREKIRTIASANRQLEVIPLDKIVGSVNRYTDFTRGFMPRNPSDISRWAQVRLGVETLAGLPPIEAYKVGDVYFIQDGHHRVSVARELGAPSIEGYVTPVYTHVPLSLGDQPDDLILKSEYDDFLNKTHLDDLRPGVDLAVTAPGQYPKLLEHIAVHRYFMGEQRHQEIPYAEAVTDWYDKVYKPVADLIRERNLLRDFPGRTEADLYLWIMDHRSELSGGPLGWEVSPELAAADLARRYSPTARRRLPRIVHKIRDFFTPETLEPGPLPGVWRTEHQTPRRSDRLFDDILAAVPGGQGSWPSVTMALEIARREDARLTGLHVIRSKAEMDSPEIQRIESEFNRRCAEAGVAGRFIVEVGKAAEQFIQRSAWVDLVIFRLNYPPPTQPMKRLRSGARLLIRRSASPLLAVPAEAPFALNSALLAYGPGPNADEALFVATYLAGRWNIPLTVVAVRPESDAPDHKTPSNSAPLEGLSASPTPIGRAREYLEAHGVQADYVEETGDAARCLLLNAERINAGLLIMGGYESGVLRESIYGSTVDHVLRSTQRPVFDLPVNENNN